MEHSDKSKNKLFTKREWILRYSTPLKAMLFMSVPMIIITLVNATYGIVDKQLTLNFAIGDVRKMVISGAISGSWDGHIVDSTHLADLEDFAKKLINVSTQYSNTIIFMLNALSLFTCVGTAIRWGQAMGKRNKVDMDSILISGFIQTFILSVLAVLILHFTTPFIITSQSNISYATREYSVQYLLAGDYTSKFILGFPLLVTATFLSTMLRTEGKVWWIIVVNSSAILVNIACGILIMTESPEGQKMAGAVYGSMVAWGYIIVVDSLIIIFSKNTLLKPKFKNFKLDAKLAIKIWTYGLPAFLSNFIFSVANYILTLLVVTIHNDMSVVQGVLTITSITGDNAYVTPALGVLSAGAPWTQVLWAPVVGMMQGCSSNYAYNKGAEKRFRILQTFRYQIFITVFWTIAVEIILLALGSQMLELFSGPSGYGMWLFYYMSCFILLAFTMATMSLFQGTGNAKLATILSISRAFVATISFALIGWGIAKYLAKNDNTGNGDKWLFIMYGFAEIPAVIAALILLSYITNKIIKQNKMYDKKDPFIPPTYYEALLNEVEIERMTLLTKLEKSIELIQSKDQSDSSENKIKRLNKQIEKVNIKMDKHRERVVKKHSMMDYKVTANLMINKINYIDARFDEKIKKISNSNRPENIKNDMISKIEITKQKIHDKKLKQEEKAKNKMVPYINGEKKLKPFALMWMGMEPQEASE